MGSLGGMHQHFDGEGRKARVKVLHKKLEASYALFEQDGMLMEYSIETDDWYGAMISEAKILSVSYTINKTLKEIEAEETRDDYV